MYRETCAMLIKENVGTNEYKFTDSDVVELYDPEGYEYYVRAKNSNDLYYVKRNNR